MQIETKLGRITIEESTWMDECYPGYIISLKNKDGISLAEVLFEVDETNDEPECNIHIWDTTKEDPVFELRGCAVSNNKLELIEY